MKIKAMELDSVITLTGLSDTDVLDILESLECSDITDNSPVLWDKIHRAMESVRTERDALVG